MNLIGKTALVTGSTSGIGLGIAHVLARAGANLILNGFGDANAVIAEVARHGTRWVGALMKTKDEEIVVVLALGLAITTAGAGERLGVSDAIGAFMVGLILAATPAARFARGASQGRPRNARSSACSSSSRATLSISRRIVSTRSSRFASAKIAFA